MSVSGVPSVPGFDVLFPTGSTNSTSTGTANSGTSSGTSSSTTGSGSLSSSIPGSDVLNSPLNTETVPGFDVLSPASYFPGEGSSTLAGIGGAAPSSSSSSNSSGSSTSSGSSNSSGSSTVNPYVQAYNNVETWSANYLMSSVEGGASSAPLYSGLDSSSNALSGDSGTVNALKSLAQFEAGAGTGTSSATSSSSTTPNTDVGSIVNALA